MERYRKLVQVADKYYMQRCGEGSWCTVIALAVAADLPFGKARSLLYKHAGRVNGRGTYTYKLHSTLIRVGLTARLIDDWKGKTLISIQREFADRKGTYFIYTKGHVTCIRDGVCEDWSNNEHGRKTRYAIESVYEIAPIF